MLRSGQGHREDGQMQRTSRHQDSEEQQGHPPQTDSDYNKHLQLKLHDVYKGWVGREGEKKTNRGRDMYREMRVEETHPKNMAVRVRVLGREEEGDRQERREDSQRRPEHAALLVPTK